MSVSHIVPVILGENAVALSAAGFLLERGFFAPAVRHPTVPRGSARLRLSVSSEHAPEQIDALVAALAEWKHAHG